LAVAGHCARLRTMPTNGLELMQLPVFFRRFIRIE
jgi:hypothetical protein